MYERYRQTTVDRQTDADYSEREREFTFANKILFYFLYISRTHGVKDRLHNFRINQPVKLKFIGY